MSKGQVHWFGSLCKYGDIRRVCANGMFRIVFPLRLNLCKMEIVLQMVVISKYTCSQLSFSCHLLVHVMCMSFVSCLCHLVLHMYARSLAHPPSRKPLQPSAAVALSGWTNSTKAIWVGWRASPSSRKRITSPQRGSKKDLTILDGTCVANHASKSDIATGHAWGARTDAQVEGGCQDKTCVCMHQFLYYGWISACSNVRHASSMYCEVWWVEMPMDPPGCVL